MNDLIPRYFDCESTLARTNASFYPVVPEFVCKGYWKGKSLKTLTRTRFRLSLPFGTNNIFSSLFVKMQVKATGRAKVRCLKLPSCFHGFNGTDH